VSSTEPIRPLQDVWLKPRRVFRELASQPVGGIDYLLGAAQGVAGWLAYSRAQNLGATDSVAEIFGKALLIGSVAGLGSLFLFVAIYSRLGQRKGGPSARIQVFHVLAYGGVPMVGSLVVWLLTALLAGEATFEQAPKADIEGFVALLLHVQFIAYVLLTLWSVLLQVMGLSEVQGVATRRALGLWILGQAIGFLVLLFLVILIATLFPNAITG
jgi:hypothetical protein